MSDESVGYSLQNLLTNLANRMGQLEGQQKMFMENWARQDSLAHESRRMVYERIELLTRQVERMATDVTSIQQDVAEMKKEIEEEITPTIEAVENRKHRAAGAKGVWALVGATIISLGSALAFIADKVAGHLWPKP